MLVSNSNSDTLTLLRMSMTVWKKVKTYIPKEQIRQNLPITVGILNFNATSPVYSPGKSFCPSIS